MVESISTWPALILMADDDPQDCLLTKKMLQKARLENELRFVQDGQELLDYLEHAGKYADPATAPRPDLILLDLNMPNKDGLGSLWEINLKPALRRIPIIILTASEAALDISESYNLGAYAYVVKPVTFGKLHDAVLRLKTCWYELSVPGSAGEPPRPAVIVMADDDPEDCLLAAKTLQAASLGNPLTYVTDGAALMDHLHGHRTYGDDNAPAPRPDLILLDLDMPEKDGGQVLAEIDADPMLRDVPIIVLTVSRDDGSVLPHDDRAGRAFITKPIDFPSFAEAIAQFESLAFRLVTSTTGRPGAPGPQQR
jgi:CheY-like chemotaxis protein